MSSSTFTAVLGDTHFRGSVFWQQLHFFDKMLEDVSARGCREVIHLGDVFDSDAIGSSGISTAEMVVALINLFTKYGDLYFYLLEGNHDQSGAGKPSAIDYFRGMGNVGVITEAPEITEFSFLNALQEPYLFIPWVRPSRYEGDPTEGLLSEIGALTKNWVPPPVFKKSDILVFGHLNITGANDNGHVCSPGGAIICPKAEDFSDYCGVFSGHIHKPQQLGDNCFYIGAFNRNKFSERNNRNGWLELSYNNGQLRSEEKALSDLGLGHNYCLISHPNQFDYSYGEYDFVRLDVDALEQYGSYSVNNVLGNPIRIDTTKKKTSLSIQEVTNKTSKSEFGIGKTLREYLIAYFDEVKLCPSDRKHVLSKFDTLDLGRWKEYDICNIVEIRSLAFINSYKDRKVRFVPEWNALLGEFGSGKSLVIEAAYAAIYGTFLNSDRQLVDLFHNGSGSVEVKFVDRKGDVYKVVRSVGPPKLEIHKNGQYFLGDGVTKTLQSFLPIVGSKEIWRKTSLMTQSREDDFVNATNTGRFSMFRDLLNFGELTKALKDIDIKLKEVNKKQAEFDRKNTQLEWARKVWADNLDKLEEAEKALETASLDYYSFKVEVDWSEEEQKEFELEQAGRDQRWLKHQRFRELRTLAEPLATCGCTGSPLPCGFIDQASSALKEIFTDFKYIPPIESARLEELKIKRAAYDAVASERKFREDALTYQQSYLQHLKETCQKAQENMLELSKAIEEYEDVAGEVSSWEFLKTAFSKSGIPALVLRSVIPQVNDYLKQITPEEFPIKLFLSNVPVSSVTQAQATSQARPDSEVIYLYASKPGWPLRDVRVCSTGERDFCALLFRVAVLLWLTGGKSIDLLLLDEPTAALSKDIGSKMFISFLKSLGVSQLIVATHDANLAGEIGNSINL